MIKIGAIFLHRKRPGFDPEWGKAITKRVKEFLSQTAHEIFIPDITITDIPTLEAAVAECKSCGVHVLIILQPTLSDGNMAASLANLWEKPFILWATPTDSTGEKIKSNSLVGTHIFASILSQFGKKYEIIYGMPDEERFIREFEETVRLVYTKCRLSCARAGLIGYQAPGYINVQADASVMYQALGTQLFNMGLHEFIDIVNSIAEEEVAEDKKKIHALNFEISGVEESSLEISSRYYLAMKKIMEQEYLDALAIRCWPELPNLLGHWPYLAIARLLSEQIPVGCEGDIDGALTCLLGNLLGTGPGYLSDWLEHDENTITTWHTGNAFFQLLEPPGNTGGPVITRHFNNNKPTVVEGTLQIDQDVTIARLWRCQDEYHLMSLDAKTIKPKRHLMGTNGLVQVEGINCHELFKKLCYSGMPHHIGMFMGHHTSIFEKLARLAGINYLTL